MDDFDWGDFAIDYSGGTDKLFDFSIDPATLGGLDLSGISLDTPYFDLGDTGTFLGGIDLSGLGGIDLGGAGYDTGAFGDYISGITGFSDAADEVGGAGYIPGIEGFAEAADEVGGAGGYDEEALKDAFWKEKLGTGVAVPGVGTLTKDSQGRTVIQYDDGTTKVINGAKDSTGKQIIDAINKATGGKENTALLTALLGGLMGLLGRKEAPKLPVGYQGGIPKYTAARVPGRGVEYTRAAQGGLMGLANKEHPIKAAKGGQYLKGSSDGMADDIYTNIDGKQPARLSSGEFVVSSDVVSALGSGNSDAGADVLYDMMDRVRKHAYGRKKQITPVNKRKVLPA